MLCSKSYSTRFVMSSPQNLLHVLVILSILSSPASPRTPGVSLWGKTTGFTSGCSQWRLRPDDSIPALQELTVCLHLQIKVPSNSLWTAFMYRSAETQWADLGLEGKLGSIVVWLFGNEWTTSPIHLPQGQWHYLCLTWSSTTNTPRLYVNGSTVDITAVDNSPLMSPSGFHLSSHGSLTLGTQASREQRVSLFRLWGRSRTRQEVMSLNCTEGDVVRWEWEDWDTGICSPVPDPTLQCAWSLYKVRLRFLIIRFDGNSTNVYTARDIAHCWLRKVLPSTIYLHRVSVYELLRSHITDTLEDIFHDEDQDKPMNWANPIIDRFECLVHVNVIPSSDVAAVQKELYNDLQTAYNAPSSLLKLLADRNSIHTTPVESFNSATVSPPTVTTESSIVTTPGFPTNTTPSTSSPTTQPKPTNITTAIPTSTTTTSTTTSTTSTSTPTPTPTTTTPTPTTTTSTSTTYSANTSTILPTTFTPSSGNLSKLYFEVKVNVSITGDCNPELHLLVWLNNSLPHDEMVVFNFQLLTKTIRFHPDRRSNMSITEGVSVLKHSRESCVFQVQVMKCSSNTEAIAQRIRELLESPYESGSVNVSAQDIQIIQIAIGQCPAHTHQTRKGLFEWPATWPGFIAIRSCPGNPSRYATRQCELGLQTQWRPPNLDQCPLVVETIPDLDHIDVTAENALDVVVMIESLLKDHSTLSHQELVTVLNKLKIIVDVSPVTPVLGQAVIEILSDIIESESDLLPFTNSILNITEAVGDRLLGYEGNYTLVAPAMAIAVVDVTPGQLGNLTFGVSSVQDGLNPEISINKDPFSGTVAFISLPSALQHSFPQYSLPRVQFQFYGIPILFKSSRSYILNTFVVSASVTNASCPIKDLDEDVKVTLHHLIPNTLKRDVQCVYWNFNKNNGHGGWDDYGCRKHNTSADYTTCFCDHLTHFGVLLDVSRTQVDSANEQVLTIITYLGCGVSSLFLGVTVLTYTAFEKLRRDYPSQILINLSLALLGLNLVFLVNSWLSSWGLYGLCVAAASTLHYFLLASFTWMGLEAVNMYFALVKVFNVYVPSYILKFCAVGWGIPLVMCVLVLVVNREAYGSQLYTDGQPSMEPLDNSDDFCWLQDDVAFYVCVVGYAVLVFLFNIGVFVVVLIQIRHMQANQPAGIRSGLIHDLKGIASLTLLLGLTWTVGFFTWGPARVALLYLFAGLNTLQGLFIFLFHCLMKENVRKQWRIHLCFGRFRLEEYSEGSNTVSVGAVGRSRPSPPVPLVPSVSSIRSVKSSATDSTSASSDSSQRHSSLSRPNLGLFMSTLALPRAQRCPSPLPHSSSSFTPTWLDEPQARTP